MKTKNIFVFCVIILTSPLSFADDKIKWSDVRIFTETNKLSAAPTALNNLTAADNVPAVDTIHNLGIEIGAAYKWFKFGTKFALTAQSATPPGATFPEPGLLTINQTTAGLVGRLPLADTPNVMFDLFAEWGGVNTTIDIRTTTVGSGTLKKSGAFYQRAGASVGFGSKDLKLYAEVGQEFNKLTGMELSGTLTTSVREVDLSGTYYSIGLIISGVPEWLTPKIGGK